MRALILNFFVFLFWSLGAVIVTGSVGGLLATFVVLFGGDVISGATGFSDKITVGPILAIVGVLFIYFSLWINHKCLSPHSRWFFTRLRNREFPKFSAIESISFECKAFLRSLFGAVES